MNRKGHLAAAPGTKIHKTIYGLVVYLEGDMVCNVGSATLSFFDYCGVPGIIPVATGPLKECSKTLMNRCGGKRITLRRGQYTFRSGKQVTIQAGLWMFLRVDQNNEWLQIGNITRESRENKASSEAEAALGPHQKSMRR